MNALALVTPGMLLAFGAVLLVAAFRPQHARLADALGVLGDTLPADEAEEAASGLDRLGRWWLDRRPWTVPPALDRQLQLRGRTLRRHAGIKLAGALAGLLLPLLIGVALWALTGAAPILPLLVSLVLAVVGFVLPDVLLRAEGRTTSEDATEALLVYFDLVTLERLANQSATQALHAAASLSDVAIFATIRSALDRARLEQKMPYGELRDVGRQLELPALVDLADVMRLDESGASLSGTLRARVKELRDAHLTTMKVHASAESERMTLFMVVPSLVFGLFFLVPPLLTLMTNG
ncbi:hypothetical protein [Propioniciclava sp.]|uniref:hypothetical protein n=1 Tax=Propioniciclava sp. TaxID=2038686 RepID=UPI00262876B1|nr:hypothetical protein [Propioniciclava sp.]